MFGLKTPDLALVDMEWVLVSEDLMLEVVVVELQTTMMSLKREMDFVFEMGFG